MQTTIIINDEEFFFLIYVKLKYKHKLIKILNVSINTNVNINSKKDMLNYSSIKQLYFYYLNSIFPYEN